MGRMPCRKVGSANGQVFNLPVPIRGPDCRALQETVAAYRCRTYSWIPPMLRGWSAYPSIAVISISLPDRRDGPHADLSNPQLKDRVAELKATRDQARLDAGRAEDAHHAAHSQDVCQDSPQSNANRERRLSPRSPARAGFGVPSSVPKWRPLPDSNRCCRRERSGCYGFDGGPSYIERKSAAPIPVTKADGRCRFRNQSSADGDWAT
jgi:hypothetical protein